ncbi:MAG: pectate lyase, partial [Firmicutes bacterium]|nr:pectate lyase [Bacillota bacterium]
MKFKAKKVLSGLLAAAMTLTSVPYLSVSALAPMTVLAASSEVSVVKAEGWYESACVQWAPVSGAAQYKAYVKKSGTSTYIQLDDPLIRNYGSYWRADALGLAAGSYSMKVEALNSSGKVIAEKEATGLSVSAYDRSGSAFSSNSTYKTGSGAYNDDGTLKSTAQVIYITADTAKTVKADVISDAKGTVKTYTGFQNIINGLQKGYDKRGFDFRIVGLVDADDMDAFGSSAEGLQVKGKAAYSEMNLTIEGVGEDATIKNFGILIRNAGNVEVRNFAIMLCMDDSLSLDTSNCNVWVHNMDCYYGSTGGDADQAKGDGTMDVKSGSTYVTFSYNHFWDNGKSSLCGMKSEKPEYFITYHHNWFDHSDSRHPRIRTMSVHVYNNYFDSCAKYGVGMTMGGSAFVENNYFLDVTKPMMISGQGTDKSGAGTFSGETGGVIKAYNNKMAFSKISSSKLSYITQKTRSTGFDAVEVSSRTDKVSSDYKAASGGTTYNNFDTSWDLAANKIDAVDNVPAIVMANAGRMNGGDFPSDR